MNIKVTIKKVHSCNYYWDAVKRRWEGLRDNARSKRFETNPNYVKVIPMKKNEKKTV